MNLTAGKHRFYFYRIGVIITMAITACRALGPPSASIMTPEEPPAVPSTPLVTLVTSLPSLTSSPTYTPTPFTPTLILAETQLPAPTQTATITVPALTSTPIPTVPPGWVTFKTDDYAIDVPESAVVEALDEDFWQVRVDTGEGEPFYVKATSDYGPGETNYFLDTVPIDRRLIGEYTWQVFVLPDGYGDALGFTPPIYALRMEFGGILYTFEFYDQRATTPLQDRILTSFRVNSLD